MKRTAIFLSALFLVSTLTGCDHTPKVSMKEDIEAEYGFDLDYSILFDKDESDDNIIVKEVKDYDKNKLGNQEITVIFSDQKDNIIEQKININVKDTKFPAIKLKKDSITLTEGDKFDALANIESVSDPVDGELKQVKDSTKEFGYTIKSDVNNNKAGDYSVVVIASDKNGNSSQKDYEVNVKAKPKPKITSDNSDKQSTVQSNNSAASSVPLAQTSNTSNSQSKPTTTQQPPQVETPPAVEPIGNTVYIAGSGKGTKYHNNPNCSNMKNPVEVTLSEAQASGYTACKKCY